MGFQVSPGVNVTERDLTLIVPAVATTNAGMAGAFQWGPVGERVLIDSENNLRQVFGDPTDETYNWFFTAANFLGYGNNLQVVRAIGDAGVNAGSGQTATIKNRTEFDSDSNSGSEFYAKYPGALGNSLKVVVLDDDGRTGATIDGALPLGLTTITGGFKSGAGSVDFEKGDRFIWSNGEVHTITEGVTGIALDGTEAADTIKFTPGIMTAKSDGDTLEFESRYAAVFNTAPTTSDDCAGAGGTNDEMNIVVVDRDGDWTGNAGEILEVFEGVSKASDAIGWNGDSIYYKNVINDTSRYLWSEDNITGTSVGTNKKTETFTDATDAYVNVLGWSSPVGGATRILGLSGGLSADNYNGTILDNGDLWTAFREFEDAETVDVSLILGGASDATVQGLIVDMCDKRKDCLAFLSPIGSASDPSSLVQNKTAEQATVAVRDWRNNTLNKSSSYAVLDSGFKVMLDRYNDVLRHVPLNGDIAGLCARTESEQEAWYSPAGFTRGQIRGVIKLDLNPRQAHRDELYKNNINPVVGFPGEGTVLYGDKTLQKKPSAFDRINVRRLFIVLEKAIATAAKYLLFEFNDEFTRAQFRNMVVPFLRTVQSRRGIYDFKVVCDESNNTADIIDRNEFVGDIYIKPARSINFIQLNFIATATGVDFSEVGG